MGIDSIGFPNLGIVFSHVGQSIRIGNFEIAYYGIIVAFAMVAGVYLAMWTAKKTGQDPDQYFSFAVVAIVLSVIGARVYYVIFSWDYYAAHPLEIFDIRGGGLAIYGGVITGISSAVIYAWTHKIRIPKMLDTGIPALALGQAIGRWGNFFNREAFGGYTNALPAMRLPLPAVQPEAVSQQMMEHAVTENGMTFIQVHPTFLYESLWNFALVGIMLFLLLRRNKAKTENRPLSPSLRRDRKEKAGNRSLPSWDFEGLVFCVYLIGYGIGRFWIEGLRTDQLLFFGTGMPVSQLVSVLLLAGGSLWLILGLYSNRKKIRSDHS